MTQAQRTSHEPLPVAASYVATTAPARPSLAQSFMTFLSDELEPLLLVRSTETLQRAIDRLESRHRHFRRGLMDFIADGAIQPESMQSFSAVLREGPLDDEVFGKWTAKLGVELRLIRRATDYLARLIRADRVDEAEFWRIFDSAVRLDLVASVCMIALLERRSLHEETREALVLELDAERAKWTFFMVPFKNEDRASLPRPVWPELTDEQIAEQQALVESGMEEWAASLDAPGEAPEA